MPHSGFDMEVFAGRLPLFAPTVGSAYDRSVRVIARRTLSLFVENRVQRGQQEAVKSHLDAWYALVARTTWASSAELKQQFRSASVVSAERVVFNIKGNDYRLVAAIDYANHVLLIKWLGTHKEYDRIKVAEVMYDEGRYTNSPR
jgi:mRNA interferase HigB